MKTDIQLYKPKVGDIILCKKSRYYLDQSKGKILINKKNEKYVIQYIKDDFIHISNELNESYIYYSIKKDKEHYYFFKYFYSIKQLRKEKIQKLYNV